MTSRARTLLVLGLLLIGCGVALILAVNNTQLLAWWSDVRSWPVLVIAAGGGLLGSRCPSAVILLRLGSTVVLATDRHGLTLSRGRCSLPRVTVR